MNSFDEEWSGFKERTGEFVPLKKSKRCNDDGRLFVVSSRAVWFMFPKREFGSLRDLRQCRELLQKNLRASRWFFL
jgi:hypothetical protein